MMQIKECTIDDVPLLAELNKLFFEEENSESNLSLPHLETRMSGYIKSGIKAFLFIQEVRIVGYALVDVLKTPVYLRQFYVSRNERRNGYGGQAFRLMLERLGIQDADDMEVYYWNDMGNAFWKSLGIKRGAKELTPEKRQTLL